MSDFDKPKKSSIVGLGKGKPKQGGENNTVPILGKTLSVWSVLPKPFSGPGWVTFLEEEFCTWRPDTYLVGSGTYTRAFQAKYL